MRYAPDDPAFAEDFVEFSDSWSRAQVNAAWAAWAALPATSVGVTQEQMDAAEERLLAALRPKILALRLTRPEMEPILHAADLTPEHTAEMDTRLYTWWANVWIAHVRALANLGNALGRRLSATSASNGTTPPQTPPTKATTKPAPRSRKR